MAWEFTFLKLFFRIFLWSSGSRWRHLNNNNNNNRITMKERRLCGKIVWWGFLVTYGYELTDVFFLVCLFLFVDSNCLTNAKNQSAVLLLSAVACRIGEQLLQIFRVHLRKYQQWFLDGWHLISPVVRLTHTLFGLTRILLAERYQ